MTNFTALSSNTHKNTRIITDRGAQYGENIHLVPIVADEINNMVLEYPLCFIKNNETGQFGLQAILGFEPNENLFLDGNAWNANYLPLHIKRQPFMVTVNSPNGKQPTTENSIISINMNNARVQETEGEKLFDDKGNATDFLTQVNQMLSALTNGIMRTEKFIQTLLDLDLIEQVQLNVSLSGQQSRSFEGVYTINEKSLNRLTGEQLEPLIQNGYLQACHLILASMGNIQKLISLKRNKL